MSLRRRRHLRREGAKASIDMNSLIDLTFLLLVVFIVTLPTLEQTIHVALPVGKAQKQDDKKKNFSVTIDSAGKIFLGEMPVTQEDLKARLAQAVAEDPETSVVIRGDDRVGYGDVYNVVKTAKECKVKHRGLGSKEK